MVTPTGGRKSANINDKSLANPADVTVPAPSGPGKLANPELANSMPQSNQDGPPLVERLHDEAAWIASYGKCRADETTAHEAAATITELVGALERARKLLVETHGYSGSSPVLAQINAILAKVRSQQ